MILCRRLNNIQGADSRSNQSLSVGNFISDSTVSVIDPRIARSTIQMVC